MTEEISSAYDNVDIKAWANQIRQKKIREFANLVDQKKKEANDYIEMDLSGFTLPKAIDEISRGIIIACDLIRMEVKLNELRKK